MTLLVVAGAVVTAVRIGGPLVLGGPPVPQVVWVAWLCAVAPFAVAAGAAVAIRRHGLGTSWRDRWPVAVTGWGCGAIGCALLMSPLSDAEPLFPVAEVGEAWEVSGDALVDVAHGVRVDSDGRISVGLRRGTELARHRPGPLEALIGVLSLALWAPLLASMPGRGGVKLAAVALAGVAFIVLVHAVGAGVLSPAWLAAAALPISAASVGLALTAGRTPDRRPPTRGRA